MQISETAEAPEMDAERRLRALADAVPDERSPAVAGRTAWPPPQGFRRSARIAVVPAVLVLACALVFVIVSSPVRGPVGTSTTAIPPASASTPPSASTPAFHAPSPTSTPGRSSSAAPMNTATASPSQPGMSREDAIRIARQTISQPATFLSAEAGRYADVAADGREGAGFPVEPGHLVWAVKFAVIVADICPPNGLPCFSPRPGTATIVLDKVTEVLLVSGVVAPAP